jgi:hypothetical protein
MSAGIDELAKVLVLGQQDPAGAQGNVDDVGIVSPR